MKIFSLDGPIYKIGTEIADAIILTFYWIICSMGIITIGASTSAVFYVYGKKVRGDDCYLTKDFFKSFKENFKQSIPMTLILAVLWVSSILYFFIVQGYPDGAPLHISVLALLITIETTLMTIYSLAVLSRFHMTIKSMFLTAFVLAHKHLLNSALIIIAIFAVDFIVRAMPILMIMTPVLIIAISSCFIQKIFTKHIEAAEAYRLSQEQEQDEEEIDEEDEDDEEVEEEQSKEKEEDKDFLKYI